MTYYSKYLKYKNKYLELKNMIGSGTTPLTATKVSELWAERAGKPGKVYQVTYPALKQHFSRYCWISPGNDDFNYGVGFFIYECKSTSVLDGYNKYGNYAVKMITLDNIGQLNPITVPVTEVLSYKTTVDLKSVNSQILPKDKTEYDWSNTHNGWIYKTSDNKIYKANYVVVETLLTKLWDERNKVGKVYPVTYSLLTPHFSRYCWISPGNDDFNYGVGFFIYECKSTSVLDGYNKYGNYAVKMITLDNIGQLNPITVPVTEVLSYKTTVDLKSVNSQILPKDKTEYDWSNTHNGWIYKTSDNKIYKANYVVVETLLNNLWSSRKDANKVYPVTYEALKGMFSHYCWISPPLVNNEGFNYGVGFFLYTVNAGSKVVQPYIQHGNYAIVKITLANIGMQTDKSLAPLNFFVNSFTTTIDLPNIPRGSQYDWNNSSNVWSYKNKDTNKIYSYNYVADPLTLLNNLQSSRKDANKVFNVTYSNLVENFSQYCWISPPTSNPQNFDYGVGFFLYTVMTGRDSHVNYPFIQVGNYAMLKITLANLGPLNVITVPVNEVLSYKTTVDLPTTDSQTLLKEKTSYDWSHNHSGWIYKTTTTTNTYKSEYIK